MLATFDSEDGILLLMNFVNIQFFGISFKITSTYTISVYVCHATNSKVRRSGSHNQKTILGSHGVLISRVQSRVLALPTRNLDLSFDKTLGTSFNK